MKKLLILFSVIALLSCEKEECYICTYQYYNVKLDSIYKTKGIECDKTYSEIKEIEYKNNAKCVVE